MSRAFAVALWVALGVAILFLTLPLLALFLRVPPDELVAQLASEQAREAIRVSLTTSLVAHAAILLFGTPAAYLLATKRFRGRTLVVSLLELPLVLPPAVAGIGLFAAFGRAGLLGDELGALGLTIPFTQLAVVLAVCFVASPFYLRAAIAAFETVDPHLLDASRTLGADRGRTFRRVALPLAAGGLGAGSTLAFARGLGEFGATIMFAGSLPGRTQTAPLAIYDSLDQDFDVALALGALFVVFSILILLAAKLIPLMDTLQLDLTVPLRAFSLDLTLEAGAGTLALAGPSGAGKTTLLRALAGLVRPARGRITVGEEVWFDDARGIDLPPERRSVGFVFQDYALFPHLTVEQNVAYGARTGGTALLERFGLAELGRARPRELSGGRQRVALARALAREPRVLLLDEPMAALDAHTRAQVRGELRALLRDLDLPTLLVTHDFEDAAALAPRVAVLVGGRLVQKGTPDELVAAPADAFVAALTGGNLLPGVAVASSGGLTEVTLESGGVVYSTDVSTGRVGVAIACWDVTVAREAPPDSALNHLRAPIASLVRLGNRVRVRVGPLTAEVTAASAERLALTEGEPVVASFKATATRLVPLS